MTTSKQQKGHLSSFPVFPLCSPQHGWVQRKKENEGSRRVYRSVDVCGFVCERAYLRSDVPAMSIYKQKSDTPKTLTF